MGMGGNPRRPAKEAVRTHMRSFYVRCLAPNFGHSFIVANDQLATPDIH